MIYMFLSNNPLSGDINSSNLSFSKKFFQDYYWSAKRLESSDVLWILIWVQTICTGLGPNCLQRLSVKQTRTRQGHLTTNPTLPVSDD